MTRWDSKLNWHRFRGEGQKETLYNQFDVLQGKIKKQNQEISELSAVKATSDLAAQVAHDIRSPLTALGVVGDDMTDFPESKRLLFRSALTRINDIANDLLQKNRTLTDNNDSQVAPEGRALGQILLSSLVDSIGTEKRLQFRSKLGIEIITKIDAQSYGLFANIQLSELKRVLSNLVNNAVEALPLEQGKIEVGLYPEEQSVILYVKDTGKGIPANVLPLLMKKGARHEKASGSGLGLYHAKAVIGSWGGRITLDSIPNHGTTVKLELIRSEPPAWFVPVISVAMISTILVLDDDLSIHHTWQKRFDSSHLNGKLLNIVHLSTSAEIREWHCQNGTNNKNVLYLIDHELMGESVTGLQLIEELEISGESILVTSRFEEQPIIEECLRLHVKVIPKSMGGLVPIKA